MSPQNTSEQTYDQFLASKVIIAEERGSESAGLRLRPHLFPRRESKAKREREAKGYTRKWLFQQYVMLKRDCTDIARELSCDPKTPWKWLTDYGIPTRPRGAITNFPTDGRSMRGKRHSDKTREILRQQSMGRRAYLRNGVHWLKSEPGLHPANWKGGITPERQAFYRSPEWKQSAKAVWTRDNATCQRCHLNFRLVKRTRLNTFHIHHVDSFLITHRRTQLDNLILMCRPCHNWIHSSENVERLYLGLGHFPLEAVA